MRVADPPGELPATMAAWVIREETQGEPRDAFKLEEIAKHRAVRKVWARLMREEPQA